MSVDRRTKAELVRELDEAKRSADFQRVQKLAAREERNDALDQLVALDDARREIRRLRDNESRRQRRKNAVEAIPFSVMPAVVELPEFMHETVREIVTDPSMREVAMLVCGRMEEFSSRGAAMIAGIGMDRKSRDHFDKMLDAHWKKRENLYYPELIIGGGLHAAVYAAVRARMGKPRPLVIDASDHPGGIFACSRGPSFFLNSRNRPGQGSIPGDSEGLNYLPGALVQPADMGSDEYQANDVLSWVIRSNLALYADVLSGTNITTTSGVSVYNGRGAQVARASQRVVLATGMGNENTLPLVSDRILSFSQCMRLMDRPFPLRGVKRVAVIGAGDSGKTVIEALTGQGPSILSASSLDFPEIHWYGVKTGQRSRTDWEKCNRSRYKSIGRLLYVDGSKYRRVILRGLNNGRAVSFDPGLDCVFVNGRPYDLVVNCTGFDRSDTVGGYGTVTGTFADSSGSYSARSNSRVVKVGPCAGIDPSSLDRERFASVGENGTSIFFLARKTAAVAMQLD